VPADRKTSALAVGLLLLSALALGGCSSTIADLPLVGTPADAPAHSRDAGAYLPVHDLPPDRVEAEMTPAEQAKALKELAAARDHQASVAAKNPAAK
jgi:hypothetical protein